MYEHAELLISIAQTQGYKYTKNDRISLDSMVLSIQKRVLSLQKKGMSLDF